MDHEEYKSLIKALDAVTQRFLKIRDMRLAATEKSKGEAGLPRIIRLSRRLKLTEKETDVMMYVLISQVRDFIMSLYLSYIATFAFIFTVYIVIICVDRLVNL